MGSEVQILSGTPANNAESPCFQGFSSFLLSSKRKNNQASLGEDVLKLYQDIPAGQFTKSSTEYMTYVENAVRVFLQSQAKKRLKDLWVEKAGMKSRAGPSVSMSIRYSVTVRLHFNGELKEPTASQLRFCRLFSFSLDFVQTKYSRVLCEQVKDLNTLF